MAKQRYIQTKIWDDPWFAGLGHIEQKFFLYLLTNAMTHICGVYEIEIRRMIFDTKIPEAKLYDLLQKFEDDGKVFFQDGWIAVKNFIKHQGKSPKIHQGILDGLKQAPKELVDRLCIDYGTLSHLNSNININSNIKIKGDELKKDYPWLNAKVWDKWVAYRSEIKKRITKTALTQQLNKLERHKENHAEMILQSIENGWVGLFPPDAKKGRSDSDAARAYHKLQEHRKGEQELKERAKENARAKQLLEQKNKLSNTFSLNR